MLAREPGLQRAGEEEEEEEEEEAEMKEESKLSEHDISKEEWREYEWEGRSAPYRIAKPSRLFLRKGGTTHRVVDMFGVAHCVPTVGERGCVLRWKNKDSAKPVNF